ncbi:MAG: hypothetical protein EA422_16285 [Gemmatimonadales bacterium]|nr:MAG: hypothetical protein EA422_16285 [Gemmatimonadales bacterium]
MKERTRYPQNVAEVARWIHWLLNALFVLVMLATIALAAWSGYRHRDAGVIGWYYAFFVIGAAVPVAIGAALLLVHGLLTRSHEWLKWPFILLVLTVLTFNAAASATQFLGVRDSITVRVENRTDSELPPVIVHGRGEHVRIPSLAAGAETSVRYRGRNIDYTRRNRYENRISAEWYVGGTRMERLLVGTYFVPNPRLVLTFHAPDSLTVSNH